MISNQVKTRDRRDDTRYRAMDNAFAILHSNSIIVTSLIDINLNGLGFEYMIDSEEHINKASALDIFCVDDELYDFHLQNIPFEIISEADVATDTFITPIKAKRYGVKFRELTPEQESRLEHFILYHTTVEGVKPGSFADKGSKGLFRRISFLF